MSTTIPGDVPEQPDPDASWGDVPEADRPLWSRYLLDHLPRRNGPLILSYIARGIVGGGTNAPDSWRQAARDLHAVGFTPLEYYLLCEILRSTRLRRELHPRDHAHLFELWPVDEPNRLPAYRLNAEAWRPWLEKVRAGASPKRAALRILHGDALPPLGGVVSLRTGDTTLLDD
ncbi:hypothetical protein [Microbacterium sp. gxy059]|uniref:hypothetical protein n=1 Tax=Microbacterium sp. gxy059 TaxID=2957199 RepID=UPI003D963C53